MHTSFPRSLCLAGSLSVVLHVAVITAASTYFGGPGPAGRTPAVVQVTFTPAIAERRDDALSLAPAPADPPEPPPVEQPPTPGADDTPPSADALPLSALSSPPDLLTPVPASIWPPFPELGHRIFQLEVIVAADGKVAAVNTQCDEALCAAADAYAAIVRTWEFTPGEYRKHPVPVRLRIEFELNPPPPETPTESSPTQPARQ